MRKAVIGVMGGEHVADAALEQARELGRLIARHGWVLLNGGRDQGVMAASTTGAHEAGGLVIGILPGADRRGAAPHLDIAIATGMGDARNVINILSSDVVIACPGSAGTLSEVALALKNGKPVILLGFEAGSVGEQYRRSGQLQTAHSPEEAVRLATACLESHT